MKIYHNPRCSKSRQTLQLIQEAGKEAEIIEYLDTPPTEQELKQITDKDVKVQINEIKRPELDAYLVAENIANQLEGRISFRRAMKMAITAAMRMGAEGIRVMCAGRLGGAEMARTEQYKEGRIPLHTFRADVDYALAEAQTVYGKIGVKVWICKGEVLAKRDLNPNFIGGKNEPGERGRGPERRDRDRGGDRRDRRDRRG